MSENVLLRAPQVIARTGMKRSTLYQAIQRGDFPAPRKIGRRAVAWPSDAVDAWINSRPPTLALLKGKPT